MSILTLFRWRKESVPLIRLTMGPYSAFATLSKSPVFFSGDTYIPEPAVDVKLPKQGISLEEEPCVVTLPLDRNLNPGVKTVAGILAQPRSTPICRIQVIQLKKASADEQIVEYLYSGILDKSRRNPSGRRNVIELEFLTELHYRLEDISLGRRADPTCDAIYGPSDLCGIDNTQFFASPGPWVQQIRRAWVTATFASYRNSRKLTLSIDTTAMPGVTNAAIYDQPKDWWVRSYLEADGVRVPIQEWAAGTTDVVLNRLPPLSWESPGKRMLLVHGCPKTPEACALRNNINRFGGLGYGIPAYNPTLEVRND